MACETAAGVGGVSPGLGFLHLSTTTAHIGTGGLRGGSPRGNPSVSKEQCCTQCAANAACTVWIQRAGRCFIGNCSSAALPCLERMRASPQAASQPAAGLSPVASNGYVGRTLLCTRPAVQPKHSGPPNAGAKGMALLLLGHRARLMLTTLPANVVRPVVTSGTRVDLFSLLENSTMARAFRGRRPMGNPEFADLNDDELAARISRGVRAAGGNVVAIRIGARPVATLPIGMPDRLSRYSDHVKLTVATRFLKERLGLQMVLEHERVTQIRYAWVLWTREDSHWFAPLHLHNFERGSVHGKACGGFGGWNDKVWLMDRDWAESMLTMYDAFHEGHKAECMDLAQPRALVSAAATGGTDDKNNSSAETDFLAAPSVEQFRERVGKLRRVPYVKHPAEHLPTMDSYFTPPRDGAGRWQLCFPRIYANGCVPKVNQSNVDTYHSCAR